jgi:YVTN family beta-propeller protein
MAALVRRPCTSLAVALTVIGLTACGSGGGAGRSSSSRTSVAPTPTIAAPAGAGPSSAPLRVPRLLNPSNVYAADLAGGLSPVVRNDPALVYVPNSLSDSVQVIDQRTYRVIRRFSVATHPEHVTPSYDLRTLYVESDVGNSLRPIDPRTGRPAAHSIPVADPYNLYFTPDGRYAITVAERLKRLDFRDPHTMALRHSLPVPHCSGVDHADYSADGRYMYLSCEYNGDMIEVDLQTRRVIKTLRLTQTASPQDVKLSPDGRTLYTADQVRGGIWEIDPRSFTVVGFLHTGGGAHGLYPSRSSRLMYVSNRTAGSISVVDFASRRIVGNWKLGISASPDMGGVSADGRTLWLSGRYNAEVYAIDTRSGRLRARIPVEQGPHGLCVWPQPGRYSLGHTGILR